MKLLINNVTCTAISGGKDFLLGIDVDKKLREYLRVRPDDYSQSPAYREHNWDGYRYFITSKGVFATGFLSLVCKYLTSLGVTLELIDKRGDIVAINTTLDGHIGNIIEGEVWTARDYQLEMVSKINNSFEVQGQKIYFPRGILDCATNSGKTSIAAILVKNLPKHTKCVFICSSKIIYQQSVAFFSASFGEPVGEVRAGKTDFKDFTICMSKTLFNRAKESTNVKMILLKMQVLIVDESDESGAKDYSKVLKYVGAGMRVFMSGTPLDSKKVNNMISIGLSGTVLGKISNRELINMRVSANPKVKILLNESINKGTFSYQTELERCIHSNADRVRIIFSKIIEKHSGAQILIAFTTKSHGYFMLAELEQLTDKTIEIVHGESKDRDDIIDRFKSGSTQILLSSMILKRGANIPNIDVLIMAQGGKSTITVKQLVGRGMRKNDKSDDVYVYDFYDQGHYVGKHSRDRIRIYKKEGFDLVLEYENSRLKPTSANTIDI